MSSGPTSKVQPSAWISRQLKEEARSSAHKRHGPYRQRREHYRRREGEGITSWAHESYYCFLLTTTRGGTANAVLCNHFLADLKPIA